MRPPRRLTQTASPSPVSQHVSFLLDFPFYFSIQVVFSSSFSLSLYSRFILPFLIFALFQNAFLHSLLASPMYPDWPETAADLVPLPLCPGPKLAAFDFQGPQDIEFLEYLGEGLHAHVLKVKIKGQEYALKLVRFPQGQGLQGPQHLNKHAFKTLTCLAFSSSVLFTTTTGKVRESWMSTTLVPN